MDRLPSELMAILESKDYSLLLYGEVGVGKSLLGLELLTQSTNPFYLSPMGHTRHIHQRYSWLSEYLSSKNILDLYQIVDSSEQRTNIKNFQNNLTRLVTSEKESPTVFINGWHSFLQWLGLDLVHWPQWHHALLELARKNHWNLIISIPHQDNLLEELVDGVIHLLYRPVPWSAPLPGSPLIQPELPRVRCLDIRKLTSVSIHRRYHVYSIAGHRFYLLHPPTFTPTAPSPKPILSSRQHISTGIRELDQLLNGGYPRRCAILLEVTPHVASRRRPLIHAAAVNTLRTGCGLLYLIEEDTPLDAFVAEHILPFIGKPKLKHLLICCLRDEDVPECKELKNDVERHEKESYCQVIIHPDDFEKTNESLIQTRQIINKRYETHLEIVESITLERIFSADLLPPFIITAKENAWRHNSAFLIIADYHTSNEQRLQRLTDLHLLLDAVDGIPVLQGLTPRFDPHAVLVDPKEGVKLLSL